MKEFLVAMGMIIIILILAVVYMGLDLAVYSTYITTIIGG